MNVNVIGVISLLVNLVNSEHKSDCVNLAFLLRKKNRE